MAEPTVVVSEFRHEEKPAWVTKSMLPENGNSLQPKSHNSGRQKMFEAIVKWLQTIKGHLLLREIDISSESVSSTHPKQKHKYQWKRYWCILRGSAILCFSKAPSDESKFTQSVESFPELSLSSETSLTSPKPQNPRAQVTPGRPSVRIEIDGIRLEHVIQLNESTVLDDYNDLFIQEIPALAKKLERTHEECPEVKLSPKPHIRLQDFLPGKRYLGCGFSITTDQTPFGFVAQDEESQNMWLEQIQKTLIALYPDRKEELDSVTYVKTENRLYRTLDVVVEEITELRELRDDYYCIVSFGNYRVCTSTRQDLVWKEDFTFAVDMKFIESPLRVGLFRKGLITEEFCGECLMHLATIEDEDAYDLLLPLTYDNGRCRTQGMMRLKLHFTYTGNHVPMLSYYGIPSKVLPYRLDTGDLLLFNNNGVPSLLGRFFTWSEWDHVAVVIKQPKKQSVKVPNKCVEQEEQLFILEAGISGVSMSDLDAQLDIVLKKGTQVGVRRLFCSQRYDDQMLNALSEFIKVVDGRPYKRNWLEIVRATKILGEEGNTEDDLSSLFCSQLCAAVYKVLKILPEDVNSNNFIPKDFASRNKIPLENGASLDSKIRLQTKVIHVDK